MKPKNGQKKVCEIVALNILNHEFEKGYVEVSRGKLLQLRRNKPQTELSYYERESCVGNGGFGGVTFLVPVDIKFKELLEDGQRYCRDIMFILKSLQKVETEDHKKLQCIFAGLTHNKSGNERSTLELLSAIYYIDRSFRSGDEEAIGHLKSL